MDDFQGLSGGQIDKLDFLLIHRHDQCDRGMTHILTKLLKLFSKCY